MGPDAGMVTLYVTAFTPVLPVGVSVWLLVRSPRPPVARRRGAVGLSGSLVVTSEQAARLAASAAAARVRVMAAGIPFMASSRGMVGWKPRGATRERPSVPLVSGRTIIRLFFEVKRLWICICGAREEAVR